ncbi:protein LIFEGUARD 4 [Cocos nucifera]|uniref:Protein LIFEGUARD 4 n=1 Tax=Cocos nucifera TaxID=13894 RepID=A0A8K0IVX5_COCNU|nr:protein LIFEGUARD 4 [Cocos nucifera]
MGKNTQHDIEAGVVGGALYPNMIENPQIRWAFVRKVYTIVVIQILLTIAVACVVIFVPAISRFLLAQTPASLAVFILIIIAPLLVMLPMTYFRERHPINLVLLMVFTICISLTVGLACATRSGKVILEAASLTAVVVVGLTLYTFWAAKRGHDFNFLGPFLFAALLVLMIYCFVQIFTPFGKVGTTIYGCLAALVFSGFIIYDTDNLIKRHSYDEYVCAAISLYLDIVNLFMALLTLFGGSDS